MKRSILLFTAAAGMAYFTLSSNADGPALNHSAGDRTDATGTCGGGGCHGSSVTDAVTFLYLTDPTTGAQILPGTNYTPGKTYNLKLNTSRFGSIKFGVQMSATDPAHTVNKGFIMPVANFIGSVPASTTGTVTLLEHTAPIVATAASMTLSNSWIAPPSGNGDVKLNAIILAANGNGQADAADVYYHISVTYHDASAINDLPSSIAIAAYPNPAQGSFNLKFENATSGLYRVSIYDLSGKKLQQQDAQVNNSAVVNFTTENLSAGMYLVQVEKDGAQRVLPIAVQ